MAKILDLGAGENPYFIRFGIPWKISDEYFYSDIDDRRLVKASLKLQSYQKSEKINLATNFKINDSIKLPYPSKTFDTVVLSNFLSAPIHWIWNSDINSVRLENLSGVYKRKLKLFKNKENNFYFERKKAFFEALRVLKPEGDLFIYTDLIVYSLASYQRLIKELKSSKKLTVIFLAREAKRVDSLNKKKLTGGKEGWHFAADVLPNSEVYKITKKPPA